ncbi:MAG: hypothetical protein P8Z49_05485 [Acidobacteriota bacterium]
MIEPHKLHRALNERLTIAGYNVLELLAAYLAFYYACTFGNLKLGLIALAASAVLIRYGSPAIRASSNWSSGRGTSVPHWTPRRRTTTHGTSTASSEARRRHRQPGRRPKLVGFHPP